MDREIAAMLMTEALKASLKVAVVLGPYLQQNGLIHRPYAENIRQIARLVERLTNQIPPEDPPPGASQN